VIELLLNAENQLALGLLDQAEQTYHTVLEADPGNGIAAVGLSRVALERGDEAGAHALARAALKIDPENATARRMIDRLDEVARYRDAAVPGREVGAAAPPDDGAATQRGSGPEPSRPAQPDFMPAEPPRIPPALNSTASPTAASHAAPARQGLLRRIFRRS